MEKLFQWLFSDAYAKQQNKVCTIIYSFAVIYFIAHIFAAVLRFFH